MLKQREWLEKEERLRQKREKNPKQGLGAGENRTTMQPRDFWSAWMTRTRKPPT